MKHYHIARSSSFLGLLLCAQIGQAVAAETNTVSNAGFEDKAQGWHAMGNRSRYGVVQKAGRGGGACLRYRKQKDETPNENSHYDQVVAVEPNVTYTAGAWFKSDGVLRPVIRIATADWQTIAVVTVPVPKKNGAMWQQAKAAFATGQQKQIRFQIFGGACGEIRQTTVGTSYCDDAFVRKATAEERRAMCRARVAVDAKAIARELNPLFFGVNALFMVEDDAALADEGLARCLREMPCRLIRYPGGEMADNYHWRTHRLHDPKHWPFRQGPDTTDTDEVMRWCRRIGAEPIFVVNLESAFVQGDIEVGVREAAEWVRYCNKEKGYNVKYWEIGNETYLFGTYYPLKAREYADAVARFSRAMKAVDPTIKIGAIGPLGPTQIVTMEFVPDAERENVRKMGKQKRRELRAALMKKLGANRRGDAWWPTVVNAAGDAMDFAVVHRYHPNVFGPDINADKPVAALRRFLREQIPNREIPVALTEWNLSRNAKVTTLGHALALAELIGDYLAGGVDLATFWPLRPTGKSS